MTEANSETWRDVPGYEGIYQVSDQGRVRSLDRDLGPDSRGRPRFKRGTVLSPSYASHGHYALVVLAGRASRTVHSLVALAFIGPRPPGQEVRHLNGDPRDTRAVNLAYGTPKENAADKKLHGTDRSQWTHCLRGGHEFTPENTLWVARGRLCRTCDRARKREWARQARRQKRLAA